MCSRFSSLRHLLRTQGTTTQHLIGWESLAVEETGWPEHIFLHLAIWPYMPIYGHIWSYLPICAHIRSYMPLHGQLSPHMVAVLISIAFISAPTGRKLFASWMRLTMILPIGASMVTPGQDKKHSNYPNIAYNPQLVSQFSQINECVLPRPGQNEGYGLLEMDYETIR